jgi:hypothetical protein
MVEKAVLTKADTISSAVETIRDQMIPVSTASMPPVVTLMLKTPQ